MQTDRRTRDRVHIFFWAVLTVVCLVAVLVARQQQAQGLQRKADAAQERAVRFTQNVLADRLDARRVARPIARSGYDELLAKLKRGLFNDQRVVRVRVWRADGMLVFTTDHRSEIGATTSDEPQLQSALQGDLVSVVVNEPFAPDDSMTPEPTTLFSTLIPLRTTDKGNVFGAVQIDNDYGIMVDAASHPWKQMEVAFAIAVLLCLAMTIVTLVRSRRPREVSGFGPSRRESRTGARDEKKVAAAQAEAAKLRERVTELEGRATSVAEQQVELERLRGRIAELKLGTAPAETGGPAEVAQVAQLKAQAMQLQEQVRGAESRVSQLRSRVSEMEGQLRVTTDQLRIAKKRGEEAQAAAEGVPSPIQARLDAAVETEHMLRAELETARAEVQRVEQERRALERAQASTADAEARIKELTQQLERSESERGMLRAGRPETVYEARNRRLEDELAQVRDQLAVAETQARSEDASKSTRSRSHASQPANGNGKGGADASADSTSGEGEAEAVPPDDASESSVVDGSELRSRLVRSNDARRRGTATPTPPPAPGPKRR